MRFGMPTLIELNSIEENILLCKELGLDFLEINMNMPYCLPSQNDIEIINRLTKEHQISLTMHFPEEIDFGTPFKIISKANIQLFEELCIYANQLHVEKINVHLLPGTVITLPDQKMYAYEKNTDQFIDRLTSSVKEIVKIASNYGVKVCMENIHVPTFLHKAYECLSDINQLSFTYDIGHDAKADYNVEKLYKNLGNKVSHMHLHDFDGRSDHQQLFTGYIDLMDRLELAKLHQMTVVIEVKNKEALRQSVEALKIRNLFI